MSSTDQILSGPEEIALRIVVLRGQRVLLDTDLARIYGVPTRRLNEQVKRNLRRFPEDFVFQLNREEAQTLARLRSQNATLKRGQHIKHLPYAFTEHGAIQAANVLNSEAAIVMVCMSFGRSSGCVNGSARKPHLRPNSTSWTRVWASTTNSSPR